MNSGVYQVIFPIDDHTMPLGDLKEEARERTRAATDEAGLIRTDRVHIFVTAGKNPLITASVPVKWAGPQPVIKGTA